MEADHRSGRRDRGASLDWAFAVLADGRRRDVVRYFRDAEGSEASLSELASYRVDRSAEQTDREQAMAALHHVGLPALADAGVVQYDARSRTARYQGAPIVERFLTAAEGAGESG